MGGHNPELMPMSQRPKEPAIAAQSVEKEVSSEPIVIIRKVTESRTRTAWIILAIGSAINILALILMRHK
jgi:hypothetical protein